MKNTLYAPILLAFCLLCFGCNRNRDCEEAPFASYFTMRDSLKTWMTAASSLDFQMADMDSSLITWEPNEAYSGRLTTYSECSGEPQRRHQGQKMEYRFSAAATGESIDITLRTIRGVSTLEIEFNDGLISYYPEIGFFGISETDEGVIRPSGTLLPTFQLRGYDWSNVLAIDAHASFITYPKIWFAKGIGIIRYENQAGKAWERLP